MRVYIPVLGTYPDAAQLLNVSYPNFLLLSFMSTCDSMCNLIYFTASPNLQSSETNFGKDGNGAPPLSRCTYICPINN
jgi:hypothetical protein